MPLNYLGSLTLGDVTPALADAKTQLEASSTKVSDDLDKATQQVNGVTDFLSQVTAVRDQAQGLVDDANAVLAQIGSNLAAPGVHLYNYDGAVGDLGAAVTTALNAGVPGGAGAAEAGYALVLVTTAPGTWTAIQAVLKTQ